MKKYFQNISLEKIKLILLITIMIILPMIKLYSYLVFNEKILNVVVLWIAIPFLFITYLVDTFKSDKPINYLDIIILILSILAFISTIFAVNRRVSIFGDEGRNEGLLTLISYYLIFVNAKNISDSKTKELLINIFLYLGLFQVLYSILEVYTDFSFIKRFSLRYMAKGLCGNPNFLASYMSMLVILAATLYIKSKKIRYLILTILYNISLTLAASSGPFLAVAIMVIFFFIYFRDKKKLKQIFFVILALILSFFATDVSSKYVQEVKFHQKINSSSNIRKEIFVTYDYLANNEIDKIGNGRIKIWKNLIPKVKDYWLFGAGIDNIGYIYPQRRNTLFVDKAHNVYLQILLTNGSLAFLFYMILLAIIFFKGFKLKKDECLYMLFIVYSIQAFANISVVDVAPYFYLFFGLFASNFNQKISSK